MENKVLKSAFVANAETCIAQLISDPCPYQGDYSFVGEIIFKNKKTSYYVECMCACDVLVLFLPTVSSFIIIVFRFDN